MKKLLKKDSSHIKAPKRSSFDSGHDNESGHFLEKPINKHPQIDESARKDYATKSSAAGSKPQNYEEEQKSLQDKNGFLSNSKKTNQNLINNQEEFKNHDNRLISSRTPITNNPNNSNHNLNAANSNKNSSNNNLINMNTNINNKTYANDTKLNLTSNANASNPLNSSNNMNNETAKNTTNVNFKYDPSTNQVKDLNVKVDMDAETAYKLYQDNKKYLPSTQQVISGAKTTANYVQNSGVLNEIGNNSNTNAAAQPKKRTGADPLSSFFGSAFGKSSGGSDKTASGANAESKKGKF